MLPIETALGRLGSRFCLNLRPQSRQIAHGAMGRYLDEVADLIIGVESGGRRRVLPLCRAGEVFESVHMELTMTSVTFRCVSRPLRVGLDVTIRAPFYPRDVETCTAPVFYLDLTAAAVAAPPDPGPGRAESQVDVFLGIKRPGTRITAGDRGLDLAYTTRIDRQTSRSDEQGRRSPRARAPLITAVNCTERISPCGGHPRCSRGEIRWRVDLSSKPQTLVALWVARVEDPVFERGGQAHQFLSTTHHASLDTLAAWAFEHREDLIAKSRFFDDVFAGSSLSKTQRDLVAFGFQSYLMNTWWVADDRGNEWFSVWEGVCRFHSTIDVEYNTSMLYFALWPELLEMTFREWAHYEKPADPDRRGRPTGFLSHDMGSCQTADGQDYPHDMEVEENTNFILLLHALWRWTGRDRMAREYADLVRRLMRFIIASDTTDNGFPDKGVANTIDDAGPAIQFAKEQTYLAVKSLCAARASADLARQWGDDGLRAECDEFVERTMGTLEKEAWLGDHYAVCIDRSADGVIDPGTGQAAAGDTLEGWDAYSLYTANGLLLPMMAGLDTGLDLDRMRTDVRAALERARCEYGCTHSSADRSNLWVSQNLWRDLAAAYLGIDCLNESDRYWAFEVHQNRQQPGRCFIDTFGWNELEYYPRGMTSIGLLLAAVGLRVNAQARRIGLAPVRVPVRVPLLPFVDWQRRVVPWVEFILEKGRVACCLDDRGVLHGWAIDVGGAVRIESSTTEE
ncbi:MAG: DUF4965 domain-containing protein [Phycisphaerales bacterium]|nr:MAG: DUF4965 domain-containing protein [Phycisphaerales bacterium]